MTGSDDSIPIHPGRILLERVMHPLGISRNQLARDIDVPVGRISDITNGKRGITADTALRLGRYFGVPAQLWLRLQAEFDLYTVRTTTWRESELRVRVLEGAKAAFAAMPAPVPTSQPSAPTPPEQESQPSVPPQPQAEAQLTPPAPPRQSEVRPRAELPLQPQSQPQPQPQPQPEVNPLPEVKPQSEAPRWPESQPEPEPRPAVIFDDVAITNDLSDAMDPVSSDPGDGIGIPPPPDSGR